MTYIIPRIWDGAQPPPPPEPSGHPPHECGQADEATEPSAAHYQWHHQRGKPPALPQITGGKSLGGSPTQRAGRRGGGI